MESKKLLSFYKKNPEVLQDMLKSATNREVAYMYSSGNFGKRPYTLENETDILELVKKGVISFHMSVERWLNPLQLSTKLKRKELNELRIGWDLVIDLDSKDFEISKYATYFILKLLENFDIKPVYVKFSGGKGFHIVIPWEIIPKELNGEKTSEKFPELARIVASYIASKIEKDLLKYIEHRRGGVENLIKDLNLDVLPENFSPLHIVEIDTILISSRHLFRMPYSLNEKTNLLSIPIKSSEVLKFEKEKASVDYYTYEGVPFLSEDLKESDKAKKLFLNAILWEASNQLEKKRIEALTKTLQDEKKGVSIEESVQKERRKIKRRITEEYYPPCIKNILNGLEDGRKRGVFILINFLSNVGEDWRKIKNILEEWNEKNPDPLKDRYIEYQYNWHYEKYKKNQKYLPPNCAREEYYKDMGVCQPDEVCKMIKNPIQYPFIKIKLEKKK